MSYFAALVQPKTKLARQSFDLLLVLMGSSFLALMAQLSIPLPFSPVPVTMQTLALFLLAGTLGSKRGMAAVLLYLCEGAMGLPVFAQGGAGLAILFGPRVGYLLAFPFATFLVGWLLERGWRGHIALSMLAMALGSVVIYCLGVFVLSFFVGGMTIAVSLGCTPFLVGEVGKILVASGCIGAGWSFIKS